MGDRLQLLSGGNPIMHLFVRICCYWAVTCLVGRSYAESVRSIIFADGAKLEQVHVRQARLNSGLTEGPAVARDGSIYFTDMPFGPDNGMILRYDPQTGKGCAMGSLTRSERRTLTDLLLRLPNMNNAAARNLLLADLPSDLQQGIPAETAPASQPPPGARHPP